MYDVKHGKAPAQAIATTRAGRKMRSLTRTSSCEMACAPPAAAHDFFGKWPPATQPPAPRAPARQMGCRGRFGYALARYSAHAWLLLVLPDLVRTCE